MSDYYEITLQDLRKAKVDTSLRASELTMNEHKRLFKVWSKRCDKDVRFYVDRLRLDGYHSGKIYGFLSEYVNGRDPSVSKFRWW